jgi:hypothetical protein
MFIRASRTSGNPIVTEPGQTVHGHGNQEEKIELERGLFTDGSLSSLLIRDSGSDGSSKVNDLSDLETLRLRKERMRNVF